MKNKVINLRRLFSNTRFLLVFSIICAFVFWIVVALEYAPVVENVIESVPVKIDFENSVPDRLGLQTFTNGEYTIDITVKGNRYDVGGDLLDADDFIVVAQTSYVDSAGTHSLPIKVAFSDPNANYEIVGLSSDYVEVYFDRYEEKEIELVPMILTDLETLTDEDYIFDNADIILSAKTVTVSGAKTEVDRITSAIADIPVSKKLTENLTIDAQVRLTSSTQDAIKHVKINNEISLKVPVTLPVYKILTLPVSVAFKNSPTGYLEKPLNYTCNPSVVKVAVMQNGSKDDKSLEVGIIDFAEITPVNNTFVFNAADINDVKILDGTSRIYVRIATESISTARVTADTQNIIITGSKDNVSFALSLENNGDVTVCGNSSSLKNIESNDISGVINLNNVVVDNKGTRVPVTYTIKSNPNCWVTGTYYAIVKIK